MRPVSTERERLDALKRYQLLDTAPNERLDRITLLVSHIFGVPIAVITLIDEHRQWFKSKIGLLISETARDIAFCNQTIRGEKPMVVRDAAKDTLFVENPLVTGKLGLRFYAAAPLRTPEGHNIGTLAVIDHVPREFSDADARILTELARFVMSELDLWRRVHELGTKHEAALDSLSQQYRREQALSERRFRALVEHAPEVILLLDRDGCVRWANPSCERVLGYVPDEMYGVDLVERLFFERDRKEARAWLSELSTRPAHLSSRPWTFRRRDGSEVHVAATVQELFDEPAVAGYVLNALDVSTEVQVQRELEHTRHRLAHAERLEAIGRLAGGVAHDFNNMLTVVLNSADLAKRRLGSGQPAVGDLEQIIDAAERGSTLVRSMLAFSRDGPLNLQVVDPCQLLTGLLSLLQRAVGEQLALCIEAGEDVPPVRLDRAQFEQVLLNLCINARDAIAGRGEITLSAHAVEVSEKQSAPYCWVTPGRFVLFTVRDTGQGMPQEVLEHAFEPFFTTKPFGKGTGLGLAIAYGVVRQHGGFMEMRSTVGEGTEIYAYLPAPRQLASA